jgi:H+/Cl- antiporter ClcA
MGVSGKAARQSWSELVRRRVLQRQAWRRRLRRWRRLPLMSPRLWMRRVAFWVGALVIAVVATSFAAVADRAGDLFNRFQAWHPAAVLLLAPAGLGGAVLLTRTVFPGAQGSGIPQVIASLHMTDTALVARVLSLRIAAGKVLLTLMGLLCGASIGREGPTVQVGASIMQALGQRLHLPRVESQRALVLAGGAAGIAAAFNTPLAGVVFAIEELSHSFEARTSGTVFTAVIVGGIGSLALVGNYTYFGSTSATLGFGLGWLAVLVCGAIGGAAGGLFAEILVRMGRGLRGRPGYWVMHHPVAFAALCGLALAVIGYVAGGTTYGTGYAQARAMVQGQGHLPGAFFALKLCATVVSYVSGMPGGIFAPSLAIGAGLGSFLSGLVPAAPESAVVLLGMVAYFSGVVQAPITSVVIVMEMTNNQSLTVPLMATAFLALGASRLICRRPLYGALARQFLIANSPAKPAVVKAANPTATLAPPPVPTGD